VSINYWRKKYEDESTFGKQVQLASLVHPKHCAHETTPMYKSCN